MSLHGRWAALTESIAPTSADTLRHGWLRLLLALYGAPGREYHARRHLFDVLGRFDEHRARFVDPATAELALWFHDAIYAVPSKRNEEASAEMCDAFLLSIGATDKHRAAYPMILATKHDGIRGYDADTHLVLDIDLAGFSDPWDAFEANNQRIRQEYAVYDEATYRAGRVAFLRGLLDRGPIFRVLTDLEAPARANIERHIAELADPGDRGRRP